MANDYTVKAGSWGEKTVAKIVRIQERAQRLQVPLLYLVDAAGGRISEQIKIFPGRFHAGRIFYNEVQLSGVVPQVCILFGPSPAGSAYLPALTDCVIMVDGKASLYVGSPRMVEMASARRSRSRSWAARACTARCRAAATSWPPPTRTRSSSAKRYLAFMPQSYRERPAAAEAREAEPGRPIEEIVPYDQRKWFDMYEVIDRVVDAGSFFEIKRLFAQEIITGFARIGGRAAGIVANQPKVKGGVLMVDSSDKAARFIWLCNAFNIPLVYLADVPGFMVGTKVERAGHHPPRRQDGLRHLAGHGAQDLGGGPQVLRGGTVRDVRAGLRAGRGALAARRGRLPSWGPSPPSMPCTTTRSWSCPESERAAYVQQKREEYVQDVDIYKLASEMLVDGIIAGSELRGELIKRLELRARASSSSSPRGAIPFSRCERPAGLRTPWR